MLTLYDFGNSVCCQKVRITMRAKRSDFGGRVCRDADARAEGSR